MDEEIAGDTIYPHGARIVSLSHNKDYQPVEKLHVAPTLVRSSLLWFVSPDRAADRPASISEYFALQMLPMGLEGHPATRHFDYSWLHQFKLSEARHLAGNMMNVCQVGSVILWCLAHWESHDASHAAASE